MVYGRTKHGSRFQMHKAMNPVDIRLRSENFIAPHPPRAQVRKVTWKKLAQIPPLRLVGAARRLINISEIPPAPGGVLRATTSPLLMLIELLRILDGNSRPDLGGGGALSKLGTRSVPGIPGAASVARGCRRNSPAPGTPNSQQGTPNSP